VTTTARMDSQHRQKTTSKALSQNFVYNTNTSPDTRFNDVMIRRSTYRSHSLAMTIRSASPTALSADLKPQIRLHFIQH